MRLGVIGLGYRRSLVAHAHRGDGTAQVVAAADANPATFDSFRRLMSADIPCCLDYRELLERRDIDAVFILTPDHLHEEHAIAALRAGKAVFLEKPMATTVEACDRILRVARETETKLYVGHNMRHMGVAREMKRLVDEGTIGEVKTAWCRHFISYGGDAYFKDWHAERARSTGLLVHKGSHDIDLLHWLCGGHTVSVQGFGTLAVYDRITDRRRADEAPDTTHRVSNWPPLAQSKLNPVIDVEDVSLINLRLSNGVLVAYQQCHFTPDDWRNHTVIGTRGRIENHGLETIHVWNRRRQGYGTADVEVPVPSGPGGHGGADARVVTEFLDHVREDAPIVVSPVDARHCVAAGDLATRSIRSGGVTLSVPPLDQDLLDFFRRRCSDR